MKELTHRDEIHGDVDYDPLAVALLNTPTLQRLGRVYQLGFGHLVYRGGTHTRLSHSMGTYATAGRLVAALRHNYESQAYPPRGAITADEFLPRASQATSPDLRLDLADPPDSTTHLSLRWTVLRHLVSWAALLHDVGHVPLGHTLEDEFEGIYEKHDRFSSPRLVHLWLGTPAGDDSDIRGVLRRTELYPEAFHRLGLTNGDDVWATVFLICTWKEEVSNGRRTSFQEILRSDISRADENGADHTVASRLLTEIDRLTPTLFSPYMADIVANTISADYLDYLRRDPQNLGLDVLKDDRVVSRFWIGKDHLDQARMALSLVDRRGKRRLDTCTGVVDLVRQRYRFAEIVYYHKTKVSASAMLAKVFHLIGAPDETPDVREIPALGEAATVVDELLAAGRSRAGKLRVLRSSYLPSTLLDTEIGDESLGILLRERAWAQLESSVKAGERESAIDAIQSITLLDAIARRELFKVAFTMDADQFKPLGGRRDSPVGDVERALGELIKRLRADASERANVEGVMVSAAGWEQNSVLLYVPPRKSQAKGIETGALADGTVVTLGDHPAVEAAVKDLSKHYSELWRLIVLVHPDHISDVIGLSDAIDAFVTAQFPGIDVRQAAVIDALESCCWFPYQRCFDRDAGRLFLQLHGGAPDLDVDWSVLGEFERITNARTTDDELAYGGALLATLNRRVGVTAAEKAIAKIPTGTLTERVAAHRDEVLASASREGQKDDAELRATQTALNLIADELVR